MQWKHLKGRTYLLKADGGKIRDLSKVPEWWREYGDDNWHDVLGNDLLWLLMYGSSKVRLWLLDTEEVIGIFEDGLECRDMLRKLSAV